MRRTGKLYTERTLQRFEPGPSHGGESANHYTAGYLKHMLGF